MKLHTVDSWLEFPGVGALELPAQTSAISMSLVVHSDNISMLHASLFYLYTLAVSPSLGGSRQQERNNKNNGGFTPFFQQ